MSVNLVEIGRPSELQNFVNFEVDLWGAVVLNAEGEFEYFAEY